MSKAGLGWSNPQRGQTHAVKSVAWLHSLGPSAWWSLSCGLLVLTPTCCPSQRSSLIGWVQRDFLFWELLQIMHAPWALSLGQVAVPGWDVHQEGPELQQEWEDCPRRVWPLHLCLGSDAQSIIQGQRSLKVKAKPTDTIWRCGKNCEAGVRRIGFEAWLWLFPVRIF